MRPRLPLLARRGLVLVLALAGGAHAATTPPVCGPAQWDLGGPAPIGSLVAGASVQTLVLGTGGTVALTGACPTIAAKVTATRKGTVVKAKWPQGTCGGVGGAARLAATIEPTCTTVSGTFAAHGLKASFTATRSPCDVGLFDTGGDPRCVAPSIDVGRAEATATLDENGCLAADLTLTSATGVSALLAQGSCLSSRGKALKSTVDLVLDDAGGAPTSSGMTGILRILARAKSGGPPIGVEVTPPAVLTLPLGDFSLAGNWFTNAFLDAEGFATTLVGASPVLLDAVPIVAAGAEQVRLDVSGPLGLSFEPANVSSILAGRAHPRAVTPSTVTLAIPTDPALPDPRVDAWQLINPSTAQIIVAGFHSAAGLGVGDSDSRVREGHAFTATLLETAGQRRVEVTSDFSNRFHLTLDLVDGSTAATGTADGDATGGCAGEACLADAYVGAVRVEARAKNFAEVVTVRDTIAAVVPAGARVVLHAVRPAGKAKQAVMSIFGLAASVKTIAPLLPGSWAVATGDRTLTIDTHPQNVLGEWQGTETTINFGNPTTCFPDDPLCARLTVTAEPNGLRIAYCNGVQTVCTGSAASAQCALLFDASVTPDGFVGVGFDNNPPCCIGCVGQNRTYGCMITATVTTDTHGQQTLEATFAGSITLCPSDSTNAPVTHLKLCRPKPCSVP